MQIESLQNIGPMSTEKETSSYAESTTSNKSMSSVEVSHAKTFPMPDLGQVLMASEADCSLKPFAWFANCNRGSLSWRTWQRCLLEDWIGFLGRWPRSGLMRNGIAYRRVSLVRISDATGCLSSPVVPSPVACDYKGSGRRRIERGANNNLRDWWNMNYGFVYPAVRVSEYLMGFPEGWTDLEDSATQ